MTPLNWYGNVAIVTEPKEAVIYGPADIEDGLELCRYMTDFPDNWDDADAKAIPTATFDFMVTVVQRLATERFSEGELTMVVAYPIPDGSIDVHMSAGGRMLVVNVCDESEQGLQFYEKMLEGIS